MNTKILGNAGESVAAEFLQRKGYRIRERNYRTKTGEIDLIAEKGGTVAFVEVKTRKSMRYGEASLSVNYRKQQKIIHTASLYISENNLDDRPCSFDVVEIYRHTSGEWTVNHFVGAFEAF